MTKRPIKSGPFKSTDENKSQQFGVAEHPEGFICIAPDPVSPFLADVYKTELLAWMAIVSIRTDYPSANQWSIRNAKRMAAFIRDDFEKQELEQGCLKTNWLIFQEGTQKEDIDAWMNAAFNTAC